MKDYCKTLNSTVSVAQQLNEFTSDPVNKTEKIQNNNDKNGQRMQNILGMIRTKYLGLGKNILYFHSVVNLHRNPMYLNGHVSIGFTRI